MAWHHDKRPILFYLHQTKHFTLIQKMLSILHTFKNRSDKTFFGSLMKKNLFSALVMIKRTLVDYQTAIHSTLKTFCAKHCNDDDDKKNWWWDFRQPNIHHWFSSLPVHGLCFTSTHSLTIVAHSWMLKKNTRRKNLIWWICIHSDSSNMYATTHIEV